MVYYYDPVDLFTSMCLQILFYLNSSQSSEIMATWLVNRVASHSNRIFAHITACSSEILRGQQNAGIGNEERAAVWPISWVLGIATAFNSEMLGTWTWAKSRLCKMDNFKPLGWKREEREREKKGNSISGTELINVTPGCATVPLLSHLKLQKSIAEAIAQNYVIILLNKKIIR